MGLYTHEHDQSMIVENPKDSIGSDKLPIHLFPTTAVALGSLANFHGNLKYGRNNWRAAGVRYTVYLDAIIRHCQAALEGEDLDPESGLPHEAHILASAGIIIDANATEMLIDDRNYKGSFWRGFVDKWTPSVKRLKEQFKDKNPKHYTIGDKIEAKDGTTWMYVNNTPFKDPNDLLS